MPITSAGRFSPRGPLGIKASPLVYNLASLVEDPIAENRAFVLPIVFDCAFDRISQAREITFFPVRYAAATAFGASVDKLDPVDLGVFVGHSNATDVPLQKPKTASGTHSGRSVSPIGTTPHAPNPTCPTLSVDAR
jgi:hypothetical protein